MPSQEEYLDNLLKGIETENTETEVTKERNCRDGGRPPKHRKCWSLWKRVEFTFPI